MTINPQIEIIESSLETIVDNIKQFYDEKKWNFITVNATDFGGFLQIDWLFSQYNDKNILKVFRINEVSYDAKIPTIVSVVVSAWLAEWELADLFGLDVENATTGVFIAPDAPKAPLRKDSSWEK